jgi:outer membrane receptor for Fe3+-dicitrate
MLTNAGAAESKGIETNIKFHPTTNFQFNISYNFSDARFTKYIDTIKNDTGGFETIDYKNNRIPYAPSHTFNINAIHTYNFNTIKLTTFLEYTGVGGIF